MSARGWIRDGAIAAISGRARLAAESCGRSNCRAWFVFAPWRLGVKSFLESVDGRRQHFRSSWPVQDFSQRREGRKESHAKKKRSNLQSDSLSHLLTHYIGNQGVESAAVG
jgi:hypothetical protein